MLLIRLADHEPVEYDGSVIELTDVAPYLDIGVPERLPRDCAKRLEQPRARSDDGLFWYRWYVLGGKDSSKSRRMGSCELVLPGVVCASTIRAYLSSEKILSDGEHRKMLLDIIAFSPSGIWDHRDETMGRLRGGWIAARETEQKSQVFSLEARIREEITIAERVLHRLSWEVAPLRAGGGIQRLRGHGMEFDLNENRALAYWSRQRLAQLNDTIRLCDRTLADLDTELGYLSSLVSDRVQARETDLERDRSQVEQVRHNLECTASRIHKIRTRLSEHGVSDGAWCISPAISRNGGLRALLARLAAPRGHLPNVESDILTLTSLAQRRSCDLYEVWAAIEIARLLRSLGYEDTCPPSINVGQVDPRQSLLLPYRAIWSLRREHTVLRWLYCPRVRTIIPPHDNHSQGLYLSQREQVAESARREQRRDEFVTPTTTNEPDYILQVQMGQKSAFIVADATFSDINFDKGKGLKRKLGAIHTKYAQKIQWIDGLGRATPCRRTPSFAISPRIPECLRGEIEKHADSHQLLVLELAPSASRPETTPRTVLSKIVATLEWACDDPGS